MPTAPYASIAADEHVATLALRVPADGVGRPFLDALAAACEELHDAIDQVHAVVVTCRAGDGDDFATGWDEETLATGLGAAVPSPGAAIAALADVPQPTVAAIGGRAHSVGLELALACDIRVAAEPATFAMPEVALGMVPMAGGTQRLPRAIGRAHAMRLLLTGDECDAAEALRIGLVSRVVPSGGHVEAAREVARAIAARGPIATRYAKEAVARGADLPLQLGLRAELDMTVILQSTADRAEGVRAFLDRREPRFTGR